VATTAGELRAPLVVGADGTRSAVAKMVGFAEYHPTPNGRVFMWAYYEADPTDGEFWIGEDRRSRVPRHADRWRPDPGGRLPGRSTAATRCAPTVRPSTRPASAPGRSSTPGSRAPAGRARSTRWPTCADFFRESAGPGWALVGDAGHFKDPTPGQGIADALRQCERLADAIEGGLGGGAAALDAALRDWWRWRDEDAGRCTGSRTTWAPPARSRRCYCMPSVAWPRIAI